MRVVVQVRGHRMLATAPLWWHATSKRGIALRLPLTTER